MKKLFMFGAILILSMNTSAFAGDPIFKTGRISLFGESFSVGMSLDKTLAQHAVRDFSSTMVLNGVQSLFIKNPDKRKKILGRTTIIVSTFIVAFELGQSNAGSHYVGLADIGVGLIAHFVSNKISKLIFKL